jgi:Right handed beta helix region
MWNRAGYRVISVFSVLSVLSLTFVAGCARPENPYFCPGRNANDNCDEPPAPSSCTSNAQCAKPTPVCDFAGSMACVQCTPDQPGACSGATPACDEDRTCRACRAHAECAVSGTCLPDGSCADLAQVAYVKPAALGGTVNTSCTLQRPCTMVAHALATGRPYVKLAGTTDEAITVQGGRVVTFLAEPNAKLTRTTGVGAILTVLGNNTSLTIYDLSISNPSGVGILIPPGSEAPTLSLIRSKVMNNPGGGISASGGTLIISQSTISGNAGGGISASGGALTVSQSTISGNSGGGISVMNGTFNITNCLIFRNGDSSSSLFGGASLKTASTNNVFAFNTVADNQIPNGSLLAGGVTCDIPGFAGANNIIVRNFVNNDPMKINSNTSGMCTYPTSTIATTVSGLSFVSPDDTPHNYHIMPGSTAIDQGTTPSTVSVDIDGDHRPQGNAPDQGADEVP